MTEEQCLKAVALYKERNRLCEILKDIERPQYKLSFIEVSKDSMTWKENMSIRDKEELHGMLDIHHVLIMDEIKKRIVDITKEIELL